MSSSLSNATEQQVISQEVMLAVLNRCDETREFLGKFWAANPDLAKQGGSKVLDLIEPLDAVKRRYSKNWL